jgi:hypothetical protein
MVNHSYISSKVKRKDKCKTRKANKKRSKIYKGGAEYYAPLEDSDRDSVDKRMESALSNFGISNTPEDKQSGWLSIGIGMFAIGGIGYVLLKKI